MTEGAATVLARLLDDHDKVRALCAELAALLDHDQPCDAAALADCRWRLARLVLRHLPVEDRHVYKRLEGHPDPAVADEARHAKVDLDAIYGAFQLHIDKWTPDRVVASWSEYRRASPRLLHAVVARLAYEEDKLFPLLDAAPELSSARAPEDKNWAGVGWTFKAKIAGS